MKVNNAYNAFLDYVSRITDPTYVGPDFEVINKSSRRNILKTAKSSRQDLVLHILKDL